MMNVRHTCSHFHISEPVPVHIHVHICNEPLYACMAGARCMRGVRRMTRARSIARCMIVMYGMRTVPRVKLPHQCERVGRLRWPATNALHIPLPSRSLAGMQRDGKACVCAGRGGAPNNVLADLEGLQVCARLRKRHVAETLVPHDSVVEHDGLGQLALAGGRDGDEWVDVRAAQREEYIHTRARARARTHAHAHTLSSLPHTRTRARTQMPSHTCAMRERQ
jgi:hypothetical protein